MTKKLIISLAIVGLLMMSGPASVWADETEAVGSTPVASAARADTLASDAVNTTETSADSAMVASTPTDGPAIADPTPADEPSRSDAVTSAVTTPSATTSEPVAGAIEAATTTVGSVATTSESLLVPPVATTTAITIATATVMVTTATTSDRASTSVAVNRPLVISAEFGGQSAAPRDGGRSDDNQSTGPAAVNSAEGQFMTGPATSDHRALVTSVELSFQTAPSSTNPVGVSEEKSFTTTGDNGGGGGGGGGGSSNGGGGSSSGGGGTILPIVPPGPCPLYLTQFIKFGLANDRAEVLKLQIFLSAFEHLEVPFSGVYDDTTYEAVKIFQSRYGRDVLGPWGINAPTGYVFITTRLAINNIYCARTTANNLDLRHFYPDWNGGGAAVTPAAIHEGQQNLEELGTTTPTLEIMGQATSSGPVVRNWLQAAAVGLTNGLAWLGWCRLINLLLLIIIIILAVWVVRLKRRRNDHFDGPKADGGQPVALADLDPTGEEEGVLRHLDQGEDWEPTTDEPLPLDNLD